MHRQNRNKWWVIAPPWLIIGAALIMAPIFAFMAQDSINRHQEETTRLLSEKGAAIIRSFEAGIRTGLGMRWGSFQFQKLLMETAEQSDIDYMIVTDTRGMIIADSDPLRIGTVYETNLDLEKIAVSKKVLSRQVHNQGGNTFEVYRGLLPVRGATPWLSRSFSYNLTPPPDKGPIPPRGFVVFAGLNMEPLEEARQHEVRRTVWSAVLFLFIGLAGIVSLMLAHGYQAARSSLSRIKAFSDSLVENMPIGLVATDAEGMLTACNKEAEGLLGLKEEDVLGRRVVEIIPPECVELFRIPTETKPAIEKEIVCSLPEGATMTLETVAAPLYEKGGGFLGNIVIFRDITEIRHLEDEVERSRRLASLGGLAAGIAHEIRNPLSSIKGFATYFLEKFADVPADREAAGVMISEVDRMNRAITQLIEFARPLKIKIVTVSLPVIIRHAVALIAKDAKKQQIVVKTEISEGKWEVPLDADRMTQVLLNLFLNAIAAMGEGGELRVSVSRQTEAMVRIIISDTGIGIPAADLSRVFDPYFTTRPAGTGLGLAICHKIVEAHRGEIFLESEQGKGTTAVVILPTTIS